MKSLTEITSPTFYSPILDKVIPKGSDIHASLPTNFRNNENLILDSFVMKINAYHVAVNIANLVLRIVNTISDVQR